MPTMGEREGARVERSEPLENALEHARAFLDRLPDRDVGWSASVDELRSALSVPLPEDPIDPHVVIEDLVKGSDGGIVGTTSPRYFGFVIGGASPAAMAADWLTSVWDQNAGLFVAGPAASVTEEVAGRWILELLGLPASCSYGFVTGCQMAHFTALAAARFDILERAGWDVTEEGLQGSPPITVIAGAQRHVTIDRALRYLGIGKKSIRAVDADDQGRMRIDALEAALATTVGPTIVCAQAGNVNTGSFDPIDRICELAHDAGAWVHVDGAFGLWAAASPTRRHLVKGSEKVDSWATDAHKWLNAPYDCGIAICAHPPSHRAAMSVHASYLIHSEGAKERDEMDWVPEFSRRARGVPVYAAIRSLGRNGVAELIDRSCDNALRFAEKLGAAPDVEILNDVVLNQVLVRFLDPGGDHDSRTARVVRGVQEDGTCWLSGSRWQDKHVMRISVSNWATTPEDVDMSVAAILRVAASV
ncbi:MAG TPA: aminotransferase class V-fold PLP-dependent enzyme [Actinomycetota bacterium]|nr:aminotransferase class V-fold PLP-dependent enzyme [Actinomycetota bacterium]